MNKILSFCIVIALSLIFLSGCRNKSQEYSIDIKFSASGLAVDNVKLHVLVDGEEKGVVSSNSQKFAFENKLQSDLVCVEIVPEITEVTPSDTFDFVCKADVMVFMDLPSGHNSFAAKCLMFQLSEDVTNAPAATYNQVIADANIFLRAKIEVTKDKLTHVK